MMVRNASKPGVAELDKCKPRYAAPALDKGLDILELLASEPHGLSQSDIAGKLNRTVGEIFRMITALERRRFIASDGADRYVLTLRMFELAHLHPPIKRLTLTALPLMQRLTQDVQQSCHLAVLNKGSLLVVAQVDSPANMGFSVRLGAQLSLTRTPSGHIILAFVSKETCQDLLNAVTEEFDQTELARTIDRIAQQGYECVSSYEVRGVRPIGYPVFDFSGQVVAVLTIPFMERLEPGAVSIDGARVALGAVAQHVSSMLGARSGLPPILSN